MSKEKSETKLVSVPSYTFDDTADENIKRFVDRKGDWQFYYIVDEKRFVPAVNHVLHLGYNKGPRFSEYLLSVSKEESRKVLEKAGDQGSRTHEAIRDLILGVKVTMETKYASDQTGRQEVLNSDEWDNILAFARWCETYQPETIECETAVYNKKRGYAGTMDWIGTILVPGGDRKFDKNYWGKRVMVLLDWKSSSGIWNEYKAQVAAYWKAVESQKKLEPFFKRYRGSFFTGVLRVGTRHKEGYEFKTWTGIETKENYRKFEAAYRIASDDKQLECGGEIENIPAEISVEIPKAKLQVKKKK